MNTHMERQDSSLCHTHWHSAKAGSEAIGACARGARFSFYIYIFTRYIENGGSCSGTGRKLLSRVTTEEGTRRGLSFAQARRSEQAARRTPKVAECPDVA